MSLLKRIKTLWRLSLLDVSITTTDKRVVQINNPLVGINKEILKKAEIIKREDPIKRVLQE